MQTKAKDPLYFLADDCIEEYEHTVIEISRRRVVSYLFRKEISSLAEIMKATNISINSLAAIFVELSEKGLVDRSDKGMWLTEAGRRWAIVNRKDLYMQQQKVRYTKPLALGRKMTEMYSNGDPLPKKYIFRD
jgi:predicted methyltransferase